MNKKCSKCNQIKNKEEFNKVPCNLDGRSSDCKQCRNKANKQYSDKKKEERKMYNIL